MVPNTLPLETTLANRIGTDAEVQTDVSTPIPSSSVTKDYKNKAGQLICVDRMGKVWLRKANRQGWEMQVGRCKNE